jgi:hypothetical protein
MASDPLDNPADHAAPSPGACPPPGERREPRATISRRRVLTAGVSIGTALLWAGRAGWVSGRTETKTYGSAADMLASQILTGRKSLW